MDKDKRCGTCRWCEKGDYTVVDCEYFIYVDIKLPAWFNVRTRKVNKYPITDCLCWKAKP